MSRTVKVEEAETGRLAPTLPRVAAALSGASRQGATQRGASRLRPAGARG